MSTDDDSANLKPKKEKTLQPLTMNQQSHEDLLAELREKTARLAEQVHGSEGVSHKTLQIDPAPLDGSDVIEALKQDRVPSSTTHKNATKEGRNPAVELIRDKLSRIYKSEPNARQEAEEVEANGRHRSKHQQFMHELTTSGKSLADIQTEWHNYYVALPDDEKHQVWQEFYEMQSGSTPFSATTKASSDNKKPKHSRRQIPPHAPATQPVPVDLRSVADIKNQLMDKVSAGGTLTAAHHFKSLLFGLGLATLVGLIMTFTFFNEVFIAPFISPAKAVSSTPIIGADAGQVGPEPKIIIPKINLEVPVVFGMDTIDEKAIQNALEEGVVHYASTPNPGEIGNSVIVGHSSNNLLNRGKYKFAFVLLKRLEEEDTFFVQKDGIRYTYKVYKKEIVGPDDVSVLETRDNSNTMTLITCDPPGTSVNRLIIVAEQISPDPAANVASTAIEADTSALNELPSNAPSLWSRLWPF